MKFSAVIIVAFAFGQVGVQEVKEQGLALFDQAELTVKQESDPARLAHGALVLASLIKDIEASRGEALLRLAARALSKLDFIAEQGQAGGMPRVTFRSPYDVDRLWEKLFEESAELRVELVREFLAEVKADDRWKGVLLARLARSVREARAMEELVELSLAHAVSFSAVSLLFDLRGRDPERGRAIFRAALERAVRRGDLDGLYWLGAYAIPGVNLPNRFPLTDPPAPDPVLARVYIRALVDVLSQVAVWANPMPAHIYRALVNIRPHAERFAPDRVPQIDSLLAFVTSRLSPRAIAEAEQRDLERVSPETEKIEDLELRAQLARDEKIHDDLMARAAYLALTGKDFERALRLAAKLKDRGVRAELRDLIHLRAAAELSERGQWEHAAEQALAIEQPERLAVAVAGVLQKLSDKDRAALLIAQAQARIERLQTSAAKGRAFLYLAGPVMSFDVDQGRFLLSRAIEMFNATRADLNGAREAAIRIETGDFATGSVVGSYDLSSVVIEAFKKLAKADPELIQALPLAARWESAEIRAIAQAAIARSLLERVR